MLKQFAAYFFSFFYFFGFSAYKSKSAFCCES